MGWTRNDSGLWGDGPQDGMNDAVVGVLALLGPEPSLVAVLAALIDALRLDGADEPLLRDKRRVEAVVVRSSATMVRVGAGEGKPEAVACFYDALDEIAVAHGDFAGAAPCVEEILGYVANSLADTPLRLPDGIDHGLVSKAVRTAEVQFDGRKAPSRGTRPEPATEEARPVRHLKFGRGVLIRKMGEKAVVRFDEHGEKVLLARFLEPSG
jgi:hypothetical protein